MITEIRGKVIRGVGGLYAVRTVEAGEVSVYTCRAKGILRRGDEKLLIGDEVTLERDTEVAGGLVISEVCPRRNALIRPPLANLDCLFAVFSATRPQPVLETVDKLIAIAEHNGICPAVVITKSDDGTDAAEEYAKIYRLAGFPTFVTSARTGEGIPTLSDYIRGQVCEGRCAAFAGASGVGKSTLLNTLFPRLALLTGSLSEKIGRGKNTTRHVELFDVSDDPVHTGFLADTPGFSLLDFARFDFFELPDLLPAFRDLAPYAGKCRYADCAHVGEGAEECAVARAVRDGKIAPSRLASYRTVYRVLKDKARGG